MFIDESIFKNKDYGTYVLRKKYYKYTIISFLISTFFVFLVFLLPLLIQFKRQINIEHTHLRPAQVPMELLDIPPEILMHEKEQLPEQKRHSPLEKLPKTEEKSEALVSVITDSSKTQLSDTLAKAMKKKENMQADEGVFECGSNLLNFRLWFMQNFQFPNSDKIKKTEGRAIAVFIVNEQGYIDSVNIVSGIDPLIDSAIKKTLLNSPRWKPCIINGRSVKQLYHFPVYLVRKI